MHDWTRRTVARVGDDFDPPVELKLRRDLIDVLIAHVDLAMRARAGCEGLLDEVIWWRTRRVLTLQLLIAGSLSGANRIAAVVGGMLRGIEADKPLRAFIQSDPDTALRILTGRSVTVAGLTAALERLIDLERSRGCFDAELDTSALAYAIMRISEGFLYADILASRAPDSARAETVIRALLTGLDRSR